LTSNLLLVRVSRHVIGGTVMVAAFTGSSICALGLQTAAESASGRARQPL